MEGEQSLYVERFPRLFLRGTEAMGWSDSLEGKVHGSDRPCQTLGAGQRAGGSKWSGEISP